MNNPFFQRRLKKYNIYHNLLANSLNHLYCNSLSMSIISIESTSWYIMFTCISLFISCVILISILTYTPRSEKSKTCTFIPPPPTAFRCGNSNRSLGEDPRIEGKKWWKLRESEEKKRRMGDDRRGGNEGRIWGVESEANGGKIFTSLARGQARQIMWCRWCHRNRIEYNK